MSRFALIPLALLVVSASTLRAQPNRAPALDPSLWRLGEVAQADRALEAVLTRAARGEVKLTAADAGSGDRFGFAVSATTDRVLVGAYNADSRRGAAYVFAYNGTSWVQQAKLVASDGVAGDAFGSAVAIEGNRAVVASGNPGSGSSGNAAYVFDFDGTAWSQAAKLVPSDGSVGERFGRSISLSGNRVLVGASSGLGNSRGAAYIYAFDGTTWAEQQKLTASGGSPGDYFGYDVSLSGDRALIGAYGFIGRGAAYVFVFNGTTWSQRTRLSGSDVTPGDQFGISVAINGDHAIVGADEGDAGGNAGGKAYAFAFDGTTWREEQKITASDRPPNFIDRRDDRFGSSVALSDGEAIIGATFAPGATNETGAAYHFARDGSTWTELQKITASDGASDDRYGYDVSLSMGVAVMGAWGDDRGDGSAYVSILSDPVPRFAVNSIDDDADATPGDGTCDTGSTVTVGGEEVPECTLRAAIEEANAAGEAHELAFEIPGTGVQTIEPASLLPALAGPIMIDATTQTGYAGSPVVVLDGGGSLDDGLVLEGNGGAVRGLAIVDFAMNGIRITGDNNRVEACHIGVMPDGTTPRPNRRFGVRIEGGAENTIGGSEEAARNVIASESFTTEDEISPATIPAGVVVAGAARENRISGNTIGLTRDGDASINGEPSGVGVLVFGGEGTLIGGDAGTPGSAPGNAISGLLFGVFVSVEDPETLPSLTRIAGNLIGTDVTGQRAVPNAAGVYLYGASAATRIGGEPGERNVISGNSGVGISLLSLDWSGNPADLPFAPQEVGIYANFIGPTLDGRESLGNGAYGVWVSGGEGEDAVPGPIRTQLGGTGTTSNVIVGSAVQVRIEGAAPPTYTFPGIEPEDSFVGLSNNVIGLLPTAEPVPGDAGVYVAGDAKALIGGVARGNVIAGQRIGVLLESSQNVVTANLIGTDVTGTRERPNRVGVWDIRGGNAIGAFEAGSGDLYASDDFGNVIVASDDFGVLVSPDPENPTLVAAASPTVIAGNRIGIIAEGTAMPNGRGFSGANTVEIGGGVIVVDRETSLLFNVIAGNVGDGVGAYGTGAERPEVRATGNLIGAVPVEAGGNVSFDPRPNTRDGIYVSGARLRLGDAGPDNEGLVPEINLSGTTLTSIQTNGRNGIGTAEPNEDVFIGAAKIFDNESIGVDVGGFSGPVSADGALGTPPLAGVYLEDGTRRMDRIYALAPETTTSEGNPQIQMLVYASATCDPSGFGEGRIPLLASEPVEPGETWGLTTTTNFEATPGAYITVRAVESRSQGAEFRSSEFSECRRVTLSEDAFEEAVSLEPGLVIVLPGMEIAIELVDGETAAKSAAQTTGTLFGWRYPFAPDNNMFEGSATAPDGSVVTPDAVSAMRYWTLATDSLRGMTYRACLDIDGLSSTPVPEQLLVVHRESMASPWRPLDSELDNGRLCAGGLTAWGDLGVGGDGSVNPVVVEEGPEDGRISGIVLRAPYPNPAPASVRIPYALPAAAHVRVGVYDLLGREVARLVDGPRTAGKHESVLDGTLLPTGVYLVRLVVGGERQTRRVALVR